MLQLSYHSQIFSHFVCSISNGLFSIILGTKIVFRFIAQDWLIFFFLSVLRLFLKFKQEIYEMGLKELKYWTWFVDLTEKSLGLFSFWVCPLLSPTTEMYTTSPATFFQKYSSSQSKCGLLCWLTGKVFTYKYDFKLKAVVHVFNRSPESPSLKLLIMLITCIYIGRLMDCYCIKEL